MPLLYGLLLTPCHLNAALGAAFPMWAGLRPAAGAQTKTILGAVVHLAQGLRGGDKTALRSRLAITAHPERVPHAAAGRAT